MSEQNTEKKRALEVAEESGISQAQVSRLEKSAIERIKPIMSESGPIRKKEEKHCILPGVM